MLPNFICIGAQRSATTWVHRCLREHPEVFVPEVKESQYFDENFDKGLSWYEAFFVGAEEYARVGEVSPNYLNVPETAQRIHDTLPGVKIFVVFRDPVDRAYSAYKLFLEEHYQGMTFRQALDKEGYLIGLGMYNRMMSPFWRLFPAEDIQAFTYDYLSDHPALFLRDLFEFLGVDPSFRPESTNRRYNRVMYRGLQQKLENLGLGFAIEGVKKTPLGDWLRERHQKKGTGGGAADGARPLEVADIAYLRDIYREEIEALEESTNLDLSAWK